MVLYCHITTHIEGEPHEKLFEEKGGGGFPTFLMLDDGGEVIARHVGDRTVPEFEKTAARAVFYLDVKKKSEAGDKSAGIDFAIARLELGTLTADEAKKTIAGLGTPSADQQAHLDAVLLNQEVMAISKEAGKDRAAAGKKFAEMKKAGKVPTGSTEYLTFWDAIIQNAEAQKDIPGFEEALARLKEKIGSNPSKQKYFQNKEEALKKLKAGK